jgi:hypothetical protein
MAPVAGAPKPPYDPTPNPPYTSQQRSAMVAWIEAWMAFGKIPGVLDPTTKQKMLSGQDDKLLHDSYQVYVGSYHAGDHGALSPPHAPGVLPKLSGPGNILDVLKTLLADITNPEWWLRVGEFLLGLLLVGVGAAKLSDRTNDVLLKYLPLMKGLVK